MPAAGFLGEFGHPLIFRFANMKSMLMMIVVWSR